MAKATTRNQINTVELRSFNADGTENLDSAGNPAIAVTVAGGLGGGGSIAAIWSGTGSAAATGSYVPANFSLGDYGIDQSGIAGAGVFIISDAAAPGTNVWLDTGLTFKNFIARSGVLLSGEDQTNNVLNTEPNYGYEVVPVTTATTLGTAGGAGDLLHKVLADAATTSIVIKDGAVTVYTWAQTATTPAESNELIINCKCLTNWELTCTGGGATAIGRFS